MTIVVQTAPATEPLTVAEVKQFCRIDGTNAEPKPGAVTAALAGSGAGNVDNGAHRYLATFVTANGETEAGVVSSAVTVADKTVNGKVSLTAIPLGGSAVTSRKLYRTIAGGSSYLLLATLADNTTTTYTDNTADSGLGAGAPSSNTTDDPDLVRFITGARIQAEQELRRYLITQTLDLYLDDFPRDVCARFGNAQFSYDVNERYRMRLPPLQSVTLITYTDFDGATQTLATDQYVVDANSIPARIEPSYGNVWPAVRVGPNSVRVRFVAGYGAASAVPQCVKQWMLVQIKSAYDNRDRFVIGSRLAEEPTEFFDSLLDPERVPGYL